MRIATKLQISLGKHTKNTIKGLYEVLIQALYAHRRSSKKILCFKSGKRFFVT